MKARCAGHKKGFESKPGNCLATAFPLPVNLGAILVNQILKELSWIMKVNEGSSIKINVFIRSTHKDYFIIIILLIIYILNTYMNTSRSKWWTDWNPCFCSNL